MNQLSQSCERNYDDLELHLNNLNHQEKLKTLTYPENPINAHNYAPSFNPLDSEKQHFISQPIFQKKELR